MKAGVRYTAVMVLATVALWLIFRDDVLGAALMFWRIAVAKAVVGLIHSVGMEATREASVVAHPGGFAFEISRGCTGFVPAALLATAIIAHPATGRAKLAGVLVGVPLLLGVNLVRLVHLYHLGVYHSPWFHVAHTVVWEAAIVLAVVGLWLGWATWADRRGGSPAAGALPMFGPRPQCALGEPRRPNR